MDIFLDVIEFSVRVFIALFGALTGVFIGLRIVSKRFKG